MKRCGKCGEWKAVREYAKRSRAQNGLQAYCRACNAAYSKRYYDEVPAVRIALRANTIAQRERNRRYIADYLRDHPCVDCGEADTIVLEFDHVRGKKIAAVCDLAALPASLERVRREIEKCLVRCANCHRRRTASQHWNRSYRRGQDFSPLVCYDTNFASRGDCSSAG